MADLRVRERWGSRIGVILAVAGSAVGLGNFLRFPGVAAQNGGGAFMLPYFISLLVLGIPLCWAEWTMGRYGGLRGFNSAPGIYRTIAGNRFSMYCGSIALLLPLVIYMYYVLIEAWCLGYAVNYLTGDLMINSGGQVDVFIEEARESASEPLSDQAAASAGFAAFFDSFVGADQDGFALAHNNQKWLFVLAGVFGMNFFLIYRGVSKGIETFCKIAMPVMAVLAIIVLVRVLTLGTPDPSKPDQSVLGGLGFMWNPRSQELFDPQTWLAASGQIFFSLSVGFGIIINYASYLSEKDDVALSGLTSSSMNEFFEVCLGGLITLPAAFMFLGEAAGEGEQGAFGLGFVALPNVFALMPGGRLFGFLWFFMLFLAAITSSVSMLQPVIAFLEEGFGLRRHASAAILGLITALGCGFVLYFSKGLVALDTFDFWVGTFLIFVLAMFQAVLYGWIFGIRRGEQELHKGAHIRIPRFVQFVLKFIVPLYLVFIFVAFCWLNLPSSEERRFEMTGEAALVGETGQPTPRLLEEFSQQEIELPANVTVAANRRQTEWTIRGENEARLYVLRPSDSADTLVAYEVKPGYIEKIRYSPVAFLSIGIICIVIVFLLILIHIAGRRWEREGRFDNAALAGGSS